MVDDQGREISEGVAHAPPHPDVEGQDPETVQKDEDHVPVDQPASAEGDEEALLKDQEKARPSGGGNGATQQEDDV